MDIVVESRVGEVNEVSAGNWHLSCVQLQKAKKIENKTKMMSDLLSHDFETLTSAEKIGSGRDATTLPRP